MAFAISAFSSSVIIVVAVVVMSFKIEISPIYIHESTRLL
jgi:hypothetical protein